MNLVLQSSSCFNSQDYSEIIDVRSPLEYHQDHIPGALNLPVLDNQERIKVGTIYKQVSPFEARKLGAALISRNIANHLDGHFADKSRHYKPLLYCWRGGKRSGSLGLVLREIGWQVTILTGGYLTYRTRVRSLLTQLPPTLSYQVLTGLTGTGKTHLLTQLKHQGAQVLDLEQLANHQGSLLGQHPTQPQPSQKWFESQLLQQLEQFIPEQPVWIESESSKIGNIYLPSTLWQSLKQSPSIEIRLPLAERVSWLLANYSHYFTHPLLLKTQLGKLAYRHSREKVNYWYSLIDQQQWSTLVTDLLQNHYDPTYSRSLAQIYTHCQKVITLDDLSPEQIRGAINELSPSY